MDFTERSATEMEERSGIRTKVQKVQSLEQIALVRISVLWPVLVGKIPFCILHNQLCRLSDSILIQLFTLLKQSTLLFSDPKSLSLFLFSPITVLNLNSNLLNDFLTQSLSCRDLINSSLNNLEALIVTNSQLTSSNLYQLIRNTQVLQSIFFSSCSHLDDYFFDLSPPIPTVRSLTLMSCYNFTDSGLVQIPHLFPSLSNLSLHSIGELLFPDNLHTIFLSLTCLNSLELTACSCLTDDFLSTQFCSIPHFTSSLYHLDLTQLDQIHDSSIESILIHCTNLQSLDVSWCNELSDCAFLLFEKPENKRYQFKRIKLRSNEKVTDTTVCRIVNGCSNLEVLSLVRCSNFTDAALRMISEKLKLLRRLNVGWSGVTSEGVKLILMKCDKLEFLGLEGCKLVTDEALKIFWSTEGPPNWQTRPFKLKLSWVNSITEQAIEKSVRRCKKLKILDFWENHWTWSKLFKKDQLSLPKNNNNN